MMAGDQDSRWSGKPVGYRQPPDTHQFKKGVSGNPRGRPKRNPSVADLGNSYGSETFKRTMRRTIKVVENGKQTRISALEAAYRSELKLVISGRNRLAIERFISRWEAAEAQAKADVDADFRHWRDYKAKQTQLIAEAKAQGRPVPRMLPHPDDIMIDEVRFKAYIDGPIDDYGARTCAHRHVGIELLVCRAEQQRAACKAEDDPLAMLLDIMAATANMLQPPSYRCSDFEMATLRLDWRRMTRRERTARLHALEAQERALAPVDVEVLRAQKAQERDNAIKALEHYTDLLGLLADPTQIAGLDSPADVEAFVTNRIKGRREATKKN